jgi:hypothetical protein
MKPGLTKLGLAVIAMGLASCAEPAKRGPEVKAPATGVRFDGTGRVTLHAGEPCTSQIVFDFKSPNARRIVWLAAPKKQSKMLTDAANHGRRVHISGVWRHGRDKGCVYVEVTKILP